MNLHAELLPGWEAWDRNGICDIPAKNVTLLNGKKGAILLNTEGVAVYDAPVDDIGNTIEEGECFVTHSDMTDETVLSLRNWLDFKDMAEAAIMYIKFKKLQEV